MRHCRKECFPTAGRIFKKITGVQSFYCCGCISTSPPPKVAAAPVVKTEEGEAAPAEPLPVAAETFTVGVTDYTFNTINAIFGRLLKAPDGHVVTLAYWNQQEKTSHDVRFLTTRIRFNM